MMTQMMLADMEVLKKLTHPNICLFLDAGDHEGALYMVFGCAYRYRGFGVDLADLVQQMPRIDEVTEAFNLPVLRIQGVEADDIIATLAKRFEGQVDRIVIVSSDKDLMQLASEHVSIFHPHCQRLTKLQVVYRFATCFHV